MGTPQSFTKENVRCLRFVPAINDKRRKAGGQNAQVLVNGKTAEVRYWEELDREADKPGT